MTETELLIYGTPKLALRLCKFWFLPEGVRKRIIRCPMAHFAPSRFCTGGRMESFLIDNISARLRAPKSPASL